MRIVLAIALALGLLLTGPRAQAQEPTLTGDLPVRGGFGLMVWSGGHGADLLAIAEAQGCSGAILWVLNASGTGFVGYFPTAVQTVNQPFVALYPGALMPEMPVLLGCRAPSQATPAPTQSPTPTPAPTATPPPAASPYSFHVTGCGVIRDYGYGIRTLGMWGEVTNNTAVRVDIFIETDFVDARGVIVDQGNAWVSGLAPGRTAQWQSVAIVEFDEFEWCEARISSVYTS